MRNRRPDPLFLLMFLLVIALSVFLYMGLLAISERSDRWIPIYESKLTITLHPVTLEVNNGR